MDTTTCTPFCERLKKIKTQKGILPSHSKIVENLALSVEEQEKGYQLGNYSDLRQRDCGFCQLVLTAVDQNTVNNSDQPDDEQEIRILLFPDEQSFRVSHPSRLGTRLAFIAQSAASASGPDNARLDDSCVESSLVKGWLEACVDSHPDCALEPVKSNLDSPKWPRRSFNESATSNFRLIDLERGCIDHAALDERYVALSYVWGDIPMLMLNTTNFDELSVDGSFEYLRPRLPRTINQVIDFVKAIGERYLWIDALCLVQDDHDDVTLGIQMMNSIYHGARCTIVAASGTDADAWLSPEDGVSQTIKEIAPGLSMTILHGIDWHLNQSRYKTRGWTLQELVLARRTIIFIDGKVHFRCRSANWSQDTWAEKWIDWQDPDDSNITRIPGLMDGLTAHLWPYQKLCEDYSRRLLRRDGDALRATVGITRTLAAGMQTDLVEGLPGYYLDHFLLFISSDGNLRRRKEFGSFSWAGWAGNIMWPRENFAWYEGRQRTWNVENILKYFKHNRIIEWSSIDRRASQESLSSSSWRRGDRERPSPLLRFMQENPTVFDDVITEPNTYYTNPRFYSSGGSHGDTPHWDWEDDREDYAVAPLRKPGFTIKGFDLINGQAEFDRMVQHVDDVLEILTLQNWRAIRHCRAQDAKRGRSKYGPRPLRSEADAEQFGFREAPEDGMRDVDKRRELAKKNVDADQVPDFPPYDILHFKTISFHLTLGATPYEDRKRANTFDRIVGIPLHGRHGELVGSLHPDNFDLLDEVGSAIELLVITKCFEPTVGSALSALSNQAPLPWKLLWVMHIVWKDNIAERRGVGQVLASALGNPVGPRPEVKLILLK